MGWKGKPNSAPNDKWETMRNVWDNSYAALDAYLMRYHEHLMPLHDVGNNKFVSNDGTYVFWHDGVLIDKPRKSIDMTPDFTLEEIEAAQNMIKGE